MYAFAVNIAIQGERERSLCTDRGARDERNKRDDGVALSLSLLFAPRVCTFALSLGDAVVYYDFQKAGRGSTGQTRRRRIKQQSVTPRWPSGTRGAAGIDSCRLTSHPSKTDVVWGKEFWKRDASSILRKCSPSNKEKWLIYNFGPLGALTLRSKEQLFLDWKQMTWREKKLVKWSENDLGICWKGGVELKGRN
jgi:hypothetical protein